VPQALGEAAEAQGVYALCLHWDSQAQGQAGQQPRGVHRLDGPPGAGYRGYRAKLTATDPSGNRSRPRTVNLRIVKH
jgi:hypothetical protein